MPTRDNIRNVAIVAHVDHGKTTLVDAMLWQSGAFGEHQHVDERAMDSNDLEREKGITILAKNTAVTTRSAGEDVMINIIDTPGHADFGGEVERGLTWSTASCCSSTPPRVRCPRRASCCARRWREAAGRPAGQQGGPAGLPGRRGHRRDLRAVHGPDATEEQIEFPIVYAIARDGKASLAKPVPGSSGNGQGGELDSDNLLPLFKTILETIPAPSYTEGAPLQAHVTNLDASNFLGRIALCRVHQGEIRKGQQVAWCRHDGTVERVKITELLMTEALERKPAEQAGPGDIIAIAGIPEIMIGDTLADPEDPRPLPLITVDEPAISMTIGTNTGPLVGRGATKGTKVTARLVKDRLDRELVGNVSLRVLPTERPDAWEVQGRGELALAILVETMRREGFELTVGKPQVVTKTIDGKLNEPVERLTIDAPEEFLGAVTQLIQGNRKGRMETMTNHGTGWVRMEFVVPSRGLIGFRTEFLTLTRGTGIAHAVFEGYEPWYGELRTRTSGSLVADRAGSATPFAMMNLQERGTMFVQPTTEVYEGMIVGENSRSDDMDVNITKEKKLTNMRSSTSDVTETLIPPRQLSLEQALEFIREDECVEVTPDTVRIRKVELNAQVRGRTRGAKAKQG